ncbi:MAG: GNAT family N-acetyltransferase [Alicyclobacillus herbarius]|uniref:GNAT family N-acetyltransferase n=1 Tax=Alicyclobacillus herbarius TaxID=122960 RepID=UPI002355D516|nr:GNAT family N-acetyltransferase [Alicyclobacillus herbarius]MCL6631192.1 GNAT family N-acetyltransferase [Alicyclobacillus herbarius]
MHDVEFRPWRSTDTETIWQSACEDADWPISPQTHSAFVRWLEGMEASCTLGEGHLEAIMHAQRLAGFWLLHAVPPHHLGTLADVSRVVEGGTYLVPASRGLGLNPVVKKRMLTVAFTSWAADWCVFVIPSRNRRAIRAFQRLPWPYDLETRSHNGRFRTLLSRREWETGSPCTLVSIHRSAVPPPAHR